MAGGNEDMTTPSNAPDFIGPQLVGLPEVVFKDEYKSGEVIIDRAHIQEKIRDFAKILADKYRGKNLLLLTVKNGAIPLSEALQRELAALGVDDVEEDKIQ